MKKFVASTQVSQLTQLDRMILREVQHDNQQSHAAIGEKVGLSGSAVRRRLKVLRDARVIERDVSLLQQSGMGVRVIISVSFAEETPDVYDAFDRQIAELPEVLQSYHVSGLEDYILIVHGPTLEWYEAWGKRVLMSNPAIRRYDTRVVWSCKKFETAISLHD